MTTLLSLPACDRPFEPSPGDGDAPTLSPVAVAEDRSLRVPAGARVRTGYVSIEDVVLGCRERMAVGDVEAAYRRQLQLGADSAWPPPVGTWREDGRFVVADGRHEAVAALMLGRTHLFVAWLDSSEVTR